MTDGDDEMTTITPINESGFGAAITGVDLARGLSDDVMRTITGALYEHRFVVIKNQSLDKQQYFHFGQQWGDLLIHVLDYLRMPDIPEMMAIGNTEAKDQDDDVRNGANLWHTDGSYKEEPTAMTMLYAIKAPAVGGQTLLCDMVNAYAGLDDETRRQIDDLRAHHFYGRAKVRANERPPSPLKTQDQVDRVPSVINPLVLTHPISGKRALYAVSHSPYEIDGLDAAETEKLLDDLKDHATSDAFVHWHKYEVGDILIFDCLATMHRSAPMDTADTPDADNARLLWRLSTKGTPLIYRVKVKVA